MILSFDEYCKLNEGSNESIVSASELIKILKPFGWKCDFVGSDGLKISKGKYVNTGHLLHGNSSLESRKVAIPYLCRLKKFLIDEFYETGDLSTIKAIPWEEWNIKPNPLKKELKDYNPETGEKWEAKVEMSDDQKTSNELYKDAILWKINYNNEDSAYIINFKGLYNTCRSTDDRRPILKDWNPSDEQNDWTPYYKEIDGKILFGRENWDNGKIDYYEVLSDGTLKENIILSESKKY